MVETAGQGHNATPPARGQPPVRPETGHPALYGQLGRSRPTTWPTTAPTHSNCYDNAARGSTDQSGVQQLNRTNPPLEREWRALAIDTRLLAPAAAKARLQPRDIALGRTDARRTPDGLEPGPLARLRSADAASVSSTVPPCGHDLRLLVASGHVVAAIRRHARPDGWRTNIGLGGTRIEGVLVPSWRVRLGGARAVPATAAGRLGADIRLAGLGWGRRRWRGGESGPFRFSDFRR